MQVKFEKLGIVVPIRNEARNLPILLHSIAYQDKIEIICCIALVDGRSTDESKEIALEWKNQLPQIQILDNPDIVTPHALNIGISTCLDSGATSILILGAHGKIAPNFIWSLEIALRRGDAEILGTVHRYPEPLSSKESAIQIYSESRFGRGLKYYTNLRNPTPTTIASCPTIRREVFDRIGLFDIKMIRNQDNEFFSRAHSAGFRIVTDPSLIYTYYPRTSVVALFRQMRGNGYWVGVRPGSHGFRYWVPFVFFATLTVQIIVAILSNQILIWIVPITFVTPYILALVSESLIWLSRNGSAAIWLPLLFVASHFAYAWGTLRGLIFHALRAKEL